MISAIRTLALCVVFCCPCGLVHAEESACPLVPAREWWFFGGADSRAVLCYVAEHDLQGCPAWDESAPDPPVTAQTAIAVSHRTALEYGLIARRDVILLNATLVLLREDTWMWVVTFVGQVQTYFHIGVLMNGKPARLVMLVDVGSASSDVLERRALDVARMERHDRCDTHQRRRKKVHRWPHGRRSA